MPTRLFRRWSSAREHARIEAGADHEQERLGVGLGAGDRGNRAVEQHGRDGAGGGGEADLVGQHVAGADGNDAERRLAVPIRAAATCRMVPSPPAAITAS